MCEGPGGISMKVHAPLTSRTAPILSSPRPSPRLQRRKTFPFTRKEKENCAPTLLLRNMSKSSERCVIQYEIDKSLKLGQGAYGLVYPARLVDPTDAVTPWDKVAKVLSFNQKGAKEARQNESEIFALIPKHGHPNVVRCFEGGLYIKSMNAAVMILERLSTQTLDRYLKKHGPLPLDSALIVFYQMAAAVQYLHSLGVSPRDIKGENIAVDSQLRVKIFDFGLSVHIPLNQENTTVHYSTGTPFYMAPEVLHKRPHDTYAADM